MTNIDSQIIAPEAIVVRLRNEGEEPFTGKYARIRYQVQPGQDIIVPYMAMCLWLGHPEAVDIDKKRRYRTQEFQRLCVKYGVYERHERVDELFPKLTAWSITDPGQEYITVVKDPDGKHLTPDVQSRQERDRMQEQMLAMQQQIAMLQAQMDQSNRASAADIAAGDTRTDNPTHRPELAVTDPDVEITNDDIPEVEMDRPGPRPVARQTG